jgi:arylsulfatase A-like enzyme
MELVDRAIGMVLEEIKKLGLYEDVVVGFINDHGEMNGRRAMVDKGVYLYPDVLRVPFIIKPFRFRKAGYRPGAGIVARFIPNVAG